MRSVTVAKKWYTRYSGWDEANASPGTVRMFDTVRMQWVERPLEEIPDEMIERRRGGSNERTPNDGTPGEITDVHLDLEESGTKHAVEEFRITIRNGGSEPLTVDKLRLFFDGEEKAPPLDVAVVEPGETETIDVLWDWIYLDQNRLTVDVRSGTETVAATDVSIDDHR